jgi:GABA(A) receptor-associated protein
MENYKEEKNFEERCKESFLMKTKFPDRVPVIVERKRQCVKAIDKRKYMTPKLLTLGQFVYVIRKRLQMDGKDAIFMFCKNKLVVNTMTMISLYESDRSDDGFLYIQYDFEHTFG